MKHTDTGDLTAAHIDYLQALRSSECVTERRKREGQAESAHMLSRQASDPPHRQVTAASYVTFSEKVTDKHLTDCRCP